MNLYHIILKHIPHLIYKQELSTITAKSYNFILQKLPNKIATLENVIITNVNNISKFNKNKNYYSSILNRNIKLSIN